MIEDFLKVIIENQYNYGVSLYVTQFFFVLDFFLCYLSFFFSNFI